MAYQATLQGHNVRYLEADGAFAAYALGGDAEQRQQLRTLVDADLLVLDGLFLARRISDKASCCRHWCTSATSSNAASW